MMSYKCWIMIKEHLEKYCYPNVNGMVTNSDSETVYMYRNTNRSESGYYTSTMMPPLLVIQVVLRPLNYWLEITTSPLYG